VLELGGSVLPVEPFASFWSDGRLVCSPSVVTVAMASCDEEEAALEDSRPAGGCMSPEIRALVVFLAEPSGLRSDGDGL